MKQVNFSHSGGFPLEQETLERLQTAYRSELFEALKSHLSITTNENYIVAMSTADKQGWAVIHQYEKDPKDADALLVLQGILYPIAKGDYTGYLKTTRTGINLVYGTGISQTAYFDYEAEYISEFDYVNGVSENSDALRIEYYDLANFKIVKDIQSIQQDIDTINQTYLPLDGSKAMKGDLDLDIYQLSKLDIKETPAANVRVADFRMGSASKRGLKNPGNPLGRALVDSSDVTVTNLHLNYESDWDNTYVGGKVHLNNLNTSNSIGSFLAIDGFNQVTRNNMVIDLMDRITALESKITAAVAVPIGMIAIWGKTDPIPSGWEEYVPLRGRVPVGLNIAETEFNAIDKTGGAKSYGLSAPVPLSSYNYSENTSSGTSGKLVISTGKQELGENLESVAIVSGSPYINFTVNNLSPYRVVQFIVYTGIQNDLTKPTNLIVTNIDFNSLRLTWTAPIDSTGLSNYVLYKNGSEYVTLGKTVTSHPFSGLAKGTYYTFAVVAKNTAGTLSAASTVGATTKDVDPTMPTNLNGESRGENSIYISWGAPADAGVINYEIYRRQTGTTSSLHKTVLGNITSYVDSGSYSTTYIYKVRAIYSSGAGPFTESEVEVTTDPIDIQCFDVESLVTMASGQSKKLKNIVIGDKLQGLTFPNEIDESDGDYMIWSGKLNEAAKAEVTVVNKITSIQPDYYEIKTADTTLKVTGQHPLLVSEDGENVKWVCVKNVLPSMLLIDKTGKTKAIESILFVEEPLEVALLDVETVDNYVISGIIAHNNKPLDPHDPQP
jgi:hypothetical protein